MYKCKKLALLFLYIEEMFIAKVIKSLPSFINSIIVVDDASVDSKHNKV